MMNTPVKRNILLNPGPATTTDTVKYAQVVPDICPREKEFGNVMRALSADLVRVVHGDPEKFTAVLFCGSGTIACAVAESTGLADGLFEQDYFQPAGVVRASVERRGGAVVSAAIGGPVTLDEPMCITL